MKPCKTILAGHSFGVLSAAVLSVLCAGICGCPNSPLMNMLVDQLGEWLGPHSSDNDPDSGVMLPIPTLLKSEVQGDYFRIEWTVDEADPNTANILGFNIYRSTDPNASFTIQKAVPRFGELAYSDVTARPGLTYYYHVVCTDRFGREGRRSEGGSGGLPPAANQVVVRAGEISGTIRPGILGVSDLTITDGVFAEPNVRAALGRLGTRWWRVGLGRWDAADMLSEAQIAERDVFVGTTMADAQDPNFYRWGYLDRVIDGVLALGAKPIVSIDTMPRSLARNRDVAYRAPILSWSDNVRNSPPADNAVFAEVVKRIIMHCIQGWAQGRTLDLPYWELWHAPDTDLRFGGAAYTFWAGSWEDYVAMFAACQQAVKGHFGEAVRWGGAAFARPESVGAFADALTTLNLRPDFVSLVAATDALTDVGFVVAVTRQVLDEHDLANVEIIMSGWNLALPVAGISPDQQFVTPQSKFDAMQHAVHYLTAFVWFNQLGVSAALHEGMIDQKGGLNLGLLTRGGDGLKPVALAVEALRGFSTRGDRLKVLPEGTVALAGVNAERDGVVLMMANTDPTEARTITLDVIGLPWSSVSTFRWSLGVLSAETFESHRGFGEPLTGAGTGRSLTLLPVLPPRGILRLEITADSDCSSKGTQ